MYLTVYPVADFCPWDPDELAKLNVKRWQNHGLPWWRRATRRDWAKVARTAVAAVNNGIDGSDRDAWHQYGQRAHLRPEDLNAYDSLADDPICVSPDQWTNGRHRSHMMQRAGATHIVAIDPDWLPDDVKLEQQATSPHTDQP